MKIKHLILWDIRLQMKYGFYFLYAVMTVIYLIILSGMPAEWREKAAAILIFSDPAAMGLFFMGAIVLLEKSQHIPYAYAVSPGSAMEYLLSKVLSLSIISLEVATILAIASGAKNLGTVLAGTLLSSVMFTLLGVIAAAKISSLNQFLLWSVPMECIAFVPALLHLYRISPAFLRFYPPNLCMDMVTGHRPPIPGLLLTAALIILLFTAARKCLVNMWAQMGGVKL